MERVNLGQLVEQVVEDLHFDDSLDITLGLDDLPEVWGNTELLRRVFVNMINNAVKYNDKSDIVINIGCAGVQERVLAPYAEIFVSDNGMGISDDDMETIFSMFVRGEQAESQASGSGIGLAIVKRIIELHYGELNVETTVGEGSHFSFTLPTESIDLTD